MRIRRTAWIAVGMLLIAGACGGDDDDTDVSGDGDDTPADETTDSEGAASGDGNVYEGELEDGSSIVVRLDVDADDPAVAAFEEFRALTGVDSPTWIVGEVTTPDGAEGTGRFITFLDEGADFFDDDTSDPTDGITTADFACSTIGEWFQAADVDEAVETAYSDLYEGPCAGQTYQVIAPAGETTTYVLVYDGPLPDFATIMAGAGNVLEPA